MDQPKFKAWKNIIQVDFVPGSIDRNIGWKTRRIIFYSNPPPLFSRKCYKYRELISKSTVRSRIDAFHARTKSSTIFEIRNDARTEWYNSSTRAKNRKIENGKLKRHEFHVISEIARYVNPYVNILEILTRNITPESRATLSTFLPEINEILKLSWCYFAVKKYPWLNGTVFNRSFVKLLSFSLSLIKSYVINFVNCNSIFFFFF